MKQMLLLVILLFTFSLACSQTNLAGKAESDPNAAAPQSEKRCGDNVCDGPENSNNCPEDCSSETGPVGQPQSASDEVATPDEDAFAESSSPGKVTVGIVSAEVHLEREAGKGDCGIDPWYSSDCSSLKTWWGLDLNAVAESAVLIIPDGANRWVVSNHPDVVSNYNLDLNDFFNRAGGQVHRAAIDFSPVPECTGEIKMSDFNFQVMGTRQEGLLELILSADPEEDVAGSCAGTGFSYSTTHLLYGWAAALSGDPLNLSFQFNDTFLQPAGNYLVEIETDTNPSPQNRDKVRARLEFFCVGSQASSILEPVPCPWEQ